jgi:poly(3-hydroxyalkanoate) synthetase
LFQENRLAKGSFVGLGRPLALRAITCPVYLLAGADDDITAPEQVLGAAPRLGTPPDAIVHETTAGGHIGLFMGAQTLATVWPRIARWILAHGA